MKKCPRYLTVLLLAAAILLIFVQVYASEHEEYTSDDILEIDYSNGFYELFIQETVYPRTFEYDGRIYTRAWSNAVKTMNGTSVVAYTVDQEYDPGIIEAYDEATLENYNVTRISPASARYNCHSYAWYSTAEQNPYYVADISPYLADPHCTEIGSAAVGAIVVYYDANGKPLHSAVVVAINGNSVICRSKWGPCGVFQHELHTVPSQYKVNGQVNEKYYRYERVHANTYSPDGSGSKHIATCTTCGYQSTEMHKLDAITNKCTICGYDASYAPIQPFKSNILCEGDT